MESDSCRKLGCLEFPQFNETMKKGIFLAAPRLVTLESNFISYSFETLVTNFPGEHFDGSRPRFRFCLVSGNFEASRLMGPNRILSFDLATKINHDSSHVRRICSAVGFVSPNRNKFQSLSNSGRNPQKKITVRWSLFKILVRLSLFGKEVA